MDVAAVRQDCKIFATMAARRRKKATKPHASARKPGPAEIESWQMLAELIETLAKQGRNWIFRGEPSTTYELRPAAGRQGEGHAARRKARYNADDERVALKRFKNDARPYVAYAD